MIDERVDGVVVPAIGLGTMRQTGAHCEELVEAALAEGYRHLDTARKYGNEAEVGAGIRRSSVPRDDILVTTKIGHQELAPDQVRAATDESLRRLGLDYVDLLLIHWPSPDVSVEDTLATMIELRDQGKARMLGVANFPSRTLERAVAAADIVTNQVEYHPYLAQAEVLSIVRANALVLTAYCPLGRGGELLQDETLHEIAVGYGRTVPQIVLRWLVQQDNVVAIPGTSSVEHLRENLAVYDFSLTEDEMARISSLARGARVVDPPHAPKWD